MAVIRAAERKNSAAIIQLFPWTMHFQGREFIKYVVREAHASSVPVAVHLDHCIGPEDVEQVLTLPFDSIMVDASTEDEAIDVEFPGVNKGNEVDLGALEWNHDGVNATFSCSQAFVPCSLYLCLAI